MRKSLSNVDIKSAARGEVTAVFSTLNVKDLDGDVTLPGAFQDGASVVISAYGHQSWAGALPVGKGTIRETASEAIVEAQFFMDTQQGKDTFTTVKHLADAGKGEWSYGYDIIDSDHGQWNGETVQFLKSLKVHEVSPVLQGAGINTRTVDAKGRKGGMPDVPLLDVYTSAIRPHDSKTGDGRWNPSDVALHDGDIVALREAHAWVDPKSDPLLRKSYRMLHHGSDGAANIRACLIGIAELNGAKSIDIPETDRQAVWNHLAAHLDEYEFPVVPKYRKASDSGDGSSTFVEQMVYTLAVVAAATDRASDVVAMRAAKGKGIASFSATLIDWLNEDIRTLKAVIDTPTEDALREYVRFIQQTQKG